ncbi:MULTISPECIES: phage virion morphogenesis protein [Lonsdalea]|uniref:Virion morphogenesis protein n=2 Tax=Lonsdalea TaxID=1082702 RepID=A0ACD1J9X0_9GAMM|nr:MULTISPECIES: phage virion morphogenesis protein [Lonsdalea]RAT11932.1 virion morphogenesis protein [Lonsdalea quercina]RAT19773.1 virion morphogenesis protein [Lonsdalea populi]RAT20415.1 virion morphogenesis protein [Lonsdalea populi]RAT26675.1 virion morphogenesis protein [Lonsdalea populi]RAT34733.1 virion morphogenesis protein [Lonsdalea populi]
MADTQRLDEWLTALLTRLSAGERKTLMREVARTLRQQQQARIRLQKNPDGTAYAPRRATSRNKAGRIRRQMFSKLRTAKYLKATASSNVAGVEFAGAVQRIARVHHYGLRDRVRPGGAVVQYAQRQLLGLDEQQTRLIADKIVAHLGR